MSISGSNIRKILLSTSLSTFPTVRHIPDNEQNSNSNASTSRGVKIEEISVSGPDSSDDTEHGRNDDDSNQESAFKNKERDVFDAREFRLEKNSILFIGNPACGKMSLYNTLKADPSTTQNPSDFFFDRDQTFSAKNVILRGISTPLVVIPGVNESVQREKMVDIVGQVIGKTQGAQVVFFVLTDSGRIIYEDVLLVRSYLARLPKITKIGIIFNKCSSKDESSAESLEKSVRGLIQDHLEEKRVVAIEFLWVRRYMDPMTKNEIPPLDTGLKLHVFLRRFSLDLSEPIRGFSDSRPVEPQLKLANHSVLFVGNPGVGKSSMLNLLGGTFKAGYHAGGGLTSKITEHTVTINRKSVTLIDLPGINEVGKQNDNMNSLQTAIREANGIKIIFFVRIESGRALNEDLLLAKTLINGTIGISKIGIIVNKCSKQDQIPKNQVIIEKACQEYIQSESSSSLECKFLLVKRHEDPKTEIECPPPNTADLLKVFLEGFEPDEVEFRTTWQIIKERFWTVLNYFLT